MIKFTTFRKKDLAFSDYLTALILSPVILAIFIIWFLVVIFDTRLDEDI